MMSLPVPRASEYSALETLAGPLNQRDLPLVAFNRMLESYSAGRLIGHEIMMFIHGRRPLASDEAIYVGVKAGEARWWIGGR